MVHEAADDNSEDLLDGCALVLSQDSVHFRYEAARDARLLAMAELAESHWFRWPPLWIWNVLGLGCVLLIQKILKLKPRRFFQFAKFHDFKLKTGGFFFFQAKLLVDG